MMRVRKMAGRLANLGWTRNPTAGHENGRFPDVGQCTRDAGSGYRREIPACPHLCRQPVCLHRGEGTTDARTETTEDAIAAHPGQTRRSYCGVATWALPHSILQTSAELARSGLRRFRVEKLRPTILRFNMSTRPAIRRRGEEEPWLRTPESYPKRVGESAVWEPGFEPGNQSTSVDHLMRQYIR